ncbi:hypothetical protein LJC58_10035, partial [Lachnospiraceae bacterium OttesenSCG-928-D06]|nr:hypothetical protein [Lachnospiraceae bacterium OttesenSCG-928-D06]
AVGRYGAMIERTEDCLQIQTGKISLLVSQKSGEISETLFEKLCINGEEIINKAYPVLLLEHHATADSEDTDDKNIIKSTKVVKCSTQIDSVEIEEEGELQSILLFKGCFTEKGEVAAKAYFHIRMYIGAGSKEIRFVHTFFYNGKEETDYMKGMGIQFDATFKGKENNRHIKFCTDKGIFHEAAILLNSSTPRLSPDYLQKQIGGEIMTYKDDEDASIAMKNLPVWDRYLICQNSPYHYEIKKQTKPECCALSCRQGLRTSGTMAVNGTKGGIMLGIKDFWQKHPSGMEVTNLAGEQSSVTAWFYSPESDAFDFRHYSDKSYPMTSYEGFPELGACAVGISVSSECILAVTEKVPTDEQMESFSKQVQKPPVYVGEPEYYYEIKAFGYFSLVSKDTEVERWLEDQLNNAIEFYKEEVDANDWYGLFDYGDFMHTYDPVRHCWRYDMGGFAWQNTELVPTYWLWLYFVRTGREDVFVLAEAMSRHCSEVDFYHFGPMKGIGTRHNVRHWGCSCKEPRVSMAGHHRFYYYLTGDYRIGDAMEDVKDADCSLNNVERFKMKKDDSDTDEKFVFVRSGPDWSSLVSNWMTKYERSLDKNYLNKIINGLNDIKSTPLGLASGPEYEYNSNDGHLVYIGEREQSGNMHLQICMGGPEIWFELADILEDEEFKEMLADYGRFYFLSQEEKRNETKGLITNRPFSFPHFASDIGAYGAWKNQDKELAGTVWGELLRALASDTETEGFLRETYAVLPNGSQLAEIPWIKTNFAAQWCMNVIIALGFIREELPLTMEEMRKVLKEVAGYDFHRA